jgi:hypothetical protein
LPILSTIVHYATVLHTLARLTSLSVGYVPTSSPPLRDDLGRLCHVCVVHPESTRTVRTLLVLSYGSATNLGFEWGFDGSSPSPIVPLGYTVLRGRVMRSRT